MALDKSFTQTVHLNATGDELLRPLNAFSKEINKVIAQLNGLSDTMTSGGHKSEDSLRKQVQLLQRLIGEANTLNTILNASTNRNRDTLLGNLDNANMGKRLASAQALKQALTETNSASQALELRLGQLRIKFNDVVAAGKELRNSDLSKQLQLEKAINDTKRLERELSLLDLRASRRGGFQSQAGGTLRSDIAKEYKSLMAMAQNPNVWAKNTDQIQILIDKVRQLAQAEAAVAREAEKATIATRTNTVARINQTEAQLRATVMRGASQFRFTADQARQFDMRAIGVQIDQNMNKLRALQAMMSRALQPNVANAERKLQRLQKYWEQIAARTSEAIAQQKAYNDLPENRRANLFQSMFGSPKAALSSMATGLAFNVGFQAFSMVQQAISSTITSAIAYEDQMAKLQAISGSTDQQMVALSASIREVAANSRYAVEEIGAAATVIAQAGFSSQETGKILKDALTLAAGSGSTPDQAVDTLTSALGAFNLQANESTRIVDTLMSALNRSKLSITQVQQAIQYAGATAKENNVDLNELVTITASLANAGIKSGSTMGTGLRQLLVDLKTPTADFKQELESLGLSMADVDVKTLGVAEVVRKLTEAGFSAEQAYASFEVRAASSFLAFRNQLDNYDALALSIAQSGAAAEANEKAMDSLTAKMNKLGNRAKEAAEDAISPLIRTFEGLVDVALKLGDVMEDAPGWFKWAMDLQSYLPPGLGLLRAFWDLVDSGSKSNEQLKTKVNEAEAALATQNQTISSIDDSMRALIMRETTLRENKLALQTETVTLTTRFEGLAGELISVADNYDGLIEAMQRYRNAAVSQREAAARTARMAYEDQAEAASNRLASNTNRVSTFVQGLPQPYKGLDGSTRQHQWRTAQAAGAAAYLNRVRDGLWDPNLNVDANTEWKQATGHLDQLRKLKSDNEYVKQMIILLEERAKYLQELSIAQGQARMAGNTEMAAVIEQSAPAQERRSYLTDVQQRTQAGLTANKAKDGSGDTDLQAVLNESRAKMTAWQREYDSLINRSKNAKDEAAAEQLRAQANSLQNAMLELRGNISSIERAQRVRQEELNDGNGPNGTTGNIKEVTLQSPIAAGNYRLSSPYSKARKNPVTGKVQAHTGQDMAANAGTPVLAAADGAVVFAGPNGAYGNMVKLDHGNGLETWYGHLKDGSFLVKEGDNVTAGQQIAGVGSTGRSTGNHLHFEVRQNKQAIDPNSTGGVFRINPSEANTAGEAAFQKQQNELQKLQQSTANRKVRTSKTKINTIMTQARTGALSSDELSQNLEAEIANYEKVSMEAWEAANPVDGLSAALLQVRENDRQEELDRIEADVTKFHADLWRWIADDAGKTLDRAFKDLERTATNETFEAETGLRNAQSQQRSLTTRPNVNRYGAGAQYLAQRDLEDQQLSADQAQLGILDRQMTGQQAAIDNYNAEIKGLAAGSQELEAAVEKRDAAEAKLNETLRARIALQQSVNERTQAMADIPIGQRLEASAQSWLENSGAMDEWGKRVENGIGPALDQLTSGLAGLFTAFATGEQSFGQALKNMLRSFGDFVVQMIMQAVALEAVKWILSAFGLTMPGQSYEGGLVKANQATNAQAGSKAFNGGPVVIPGRFNGGLAANDNYPGLYGGGRPRKILNGGRVNQGTPTRDSALYELAENEYVVRNKSVRDLGLGFMNEINQHGRAGLQKMMGAGTAFTNIQAPKQETNVYVVQDKAEAGMGPNDVLITIQKDILQNGTTKKLIKQVAQGG